MDSTSPHPTKVTLKIPQVSKLSELGFCEENAAEEMLSFFGEGHGIALRGFSRATDQAGNVIDLSIRFLIDDIEKTVPRFAQLFLDHGFPEGTTLTGIVCDESGNDKLEEFLRFKAAEC